MPPTPLIDLAIIDTSRVLYDLEDLRRGNPQRFEMEHVSAIVHLDRDALVIVGYKDVRPDEFWVRGHMPGHPSMPGVLMCEAAAQLCGFFCHLIDIISDGFLGFGGMEHVRFRGPVKPEDRLMLVGKGEKVRRRQTVFDVQGFVDAHLVFYGRIMGVPLTNISGTKKPARFASGG